MRKTILYIIPLLLLGVAAYSQKKLTEATIYYDVVINTGNAKPKAADMLDGSTHIIYTKGNLNRSDFISALGSETTIFDAKTSTATNIKDYGDKKFLITYSPAEWKLYNKKYDGLTYTLQKENKKIAGYNCQKAIGKLTDGTVFTVFFTNDLVPISNEFQYINKNLPGLVMQYEASKGNVKIVYTVSNIEFGVIPLAKFDVPKSGYRTMSYSDFSKEAGSRK